MNASRRREKVRCIRAIAVLIAGAVSLTACSGSFASSPGKNDEPTISEDAIQAAHSLGAKRIRFRWPQKPTNSVSLLASRSDAVVRGRLSHITRGRSTSAGDQSIVLVLDEVKIIGGRTQNADQVRVELWPAAHRTVKQFGRLLPRGSAVVMYLDQAGDHGTANRKVTAAESSRDLYTPINRSAFILQIKATHDIAWPLKGSFSIEPLRDFLPT